MPDSTTDSSASITSKTGLSLLTGASRLALSSDNVRVAVTGAIYVAPVGTTAPTDSSTALPVDWSELGYLSEDGVTISPSQTETQSITAWQDSAEVRKAVTRVENTVSFTMIEIQAATLEVFFGTPISVGASDYTFGGPGLERNAFVFDVIDGSEEIRYYIPQAEVTSRGEIAYRNGSPIGLNVTLSAYPDNSLGNLPFKAFHGTALS